MANIPEEDREKVKIKLEKVETWGDLEVFLEGGHYFPS